MVTPHLISPPIEAIRVDCDADLGLPRLLIHECEFDRRATGEDRSAVLAALAENGGWILERGAAPAGFLMPAERACRPIVAPRFEDGLILLDLHRHVVLASAHVRAGIPDEQATA